MASAFRCQARSYLSRRQGKRDGSSLEVVTSPAAGPAPSCLEALNTAVLTTENRKYGAPRQSCEDFCALVLELS